MSPLFRKKRIAIQETLGEKLKKTRLGKNWSLEVASKETNISRRHLAALEKSRYEEIPGEVYITNFIKIYSQRLGLSASLSLQTYAEEKHVIEQKKYSHFLKELDAGTFIDGLLKPETIKKSLICIVVGLVLSYIVLNLHNSVAPPLLEIYFPKDNVEISDMTIRVFGKTHAEAKLLINNEEVLMNDAGAFEEIVTLHEGLNLIIIKAKKKHGMERKLLRHVLVTTPKMAAQD